MRKKTPNKQKIKHQYKKQQQIQRISLNKSTLTDQN